MTFEMEAAFNRDKDIVVSKQITHENEVNKVHLIFSLQKNIEFLKLKHHEMLVTLHSEIERLKRTNNELQQELILGRNHAQSSIESTENVKLLTRINELEAQLQAALTKNELLKRELESSKKHSLSKRHNFAETHSPIIQKAEQIRNATVCNPTEDVTVIAGDLPISFLPEEASCAPICNRNLIGPSPSLEKRKGYYD
uniref:CCDC92 domain-containing protein n=1 Tax=Mesocestoides corti TaxID=53468 RepID=A0A5K3ERA9_MESCO